MKKILLLGVSDNGWRTYAIYDAPRSNGKILKQKRQKKRRTKQRLTKQSRQKNR